MAIESLATHRPEILDSGGLIARRTIQLPDPFEDMGAMLLRHVLMTLLERSGDGTAAAAVMTHTLIRRLLRYLQHGGNPVELRLGLDRALRAALASLAEQAQPIEGRRAIEQVASAAVRDACIARLIGEIFDATGSQGAIIVEDAEALETTFEYIEGMRWNEGLASDALLVPPHTSVRMVEPRLLITDCELQTPDQLLPILEVCLAAGERKLFVIAPEIRDPVLALLTTNRDRGVLESVAAVRAPSIGSGREGILDDLAVATGGRFLRAAGGGLTGASLQDLGRARQAWASRGAFAIVGGRGAREDVRARVSVLQAERARASDDHAASTLAQQRIARLLGLGAVIRAGAATPLERDEVRLRTEAGVTTTRLALEEGVVAGGGAALVGCAQAVRACQMPGDAGVAAEVLAVALEAPMRAIVHNAGYDSSPILHAARSCAPARAFDVLEGAWVDPFAAGLVDPVAVLRASVEASVSVARTAMTTDVLVRRRQVAPPAGR